MAAALGLSGPRPAKPKVAPEAPLEAGGGRVEKEDRQARGLRLAGQLWAGQREHLSKLVADLEIADAADFLAKHAALGPESEQAKMTFLADIETTLKAASSGDVTERRAADLLTKLREAVQTPAVTRLVGAAGRLSLMNWIADVSAWRDRAMYAAIQAAANDSAGRDAAIRYLEGGTEQVMRSRVTAYADWCRAMERPMPMRFTVRLEWNDWYDSKATRVWMSIGETLILDLPIPSSKNGESPLIPTDVIELNPSQPFKIDFRVTVTDSPIVFSERLGGEHKSEIWRPRDYDGPAVAVNESRRTRAVIVAVLPPRPPLPAWRDEGR